MAVGRKLFQSAMALSFLWAAVLFVVAAWYWLNKPSAPAPRPRDVTYFVSPSGRVIPVSAADVRGVAESGEYVPATPTQIRDYETEQQSAEDEYPSTALILLVIGLLPGAMLIGARSWARWLNS